MRGKAIFSNGEKKVHLKTGMKLDGPGVIATWKRSYVKLDMNGKGRVTVGAKSKIVLKKETPRSPALISLLNGKIRAKMKKTSSKKHKLYINTRSASVGVRGTELLVVYNNKNHITSNITLSGEVDFHKKSDESILRSLKEDLDDGSDKSLIESLDTTELSDQFKGRKFVRIRKGQFSGAYPTYDTPLAPTKLSNIQYKVLNKSDEESALSKKKSGVVYNKVLRRKKFKLTNKNLIPEPKGDKTEELITYNDKVVTSGINVRPGGVIDLKTGIYVMPPKGSHYDKKTGTYLLPSDYGGIDSKSGNYVPPKDVEIDPLQGFVKWENGVKKQIDKFSKAVTDLFDKYKKLTRIDLSASANYYFSLKSYENYYGEFRNITDSESMTFDFNGSIGRHLYNNKRYLHYLKAGIDTILHNRRNEPLVQRNDRLVTHYGYEFHRKHKVKKRKARFVIDLDFETTYQDYKNKDQFDFYTESSKMKVYEEFFTSRRHSMKVGTMVSAFQGHEDNNHGNIYDFFWHNKITSNRPYSFDLNFDFRSRQEKISDDDFRIYKAYLGVTRHDIFRKADLNLLSGFEYHDSEKNVSIDRARVQQYKVELLRRKGEYLKFKLFYRYLKQNADGKEYRDFSQQEWGIGSTFIF